MKSIFFSDLHFDISGKDAAARGFAAALTNSFQMGYERLFILGDLFNYWFEHKNVDHYTANPVLSLLQEQVQSGRTIIFIKGNRDFAAAAGFSGASGIEAILDDYRYVSGGKNILLTHGDSLVKQDIRYQIWKWMIRSRFSSFIFSRLPVNGAIKAADRFKMVGKKNPRSDKTIADMIKKGAAEMLTNSEVDVIVTGHAHLKSYLKLEAGGKEKELFIAPEYCFPGEFLTEEDGNFSYCRLEDQQSIVS